MTNGFEGAATQRERAGPAMIRALGNPKVFWGSILGWGLFSALANYVEGEVPWTKWVFDALVVVAAVGWWLLWRRRQRRRPAAPAGSGRARMRALRARAG